MDEIEATKQAYIEVNRKNNPNAVHGAKLEEAYPDDSEDVEITYIRDEDDIEDALFKILSTNGEEE